MSISVAVAGDHCVLDEGEQPELVRSSLLLRQALRKGSVMSATLPERNESSHEPGARMATWSDARNRSEPELSGGWILPCQASRIGGKEQSSPGARTLCPLRKRVALTG